jgi:hypothetical protein
LSDGPLVPDVIPGREQVNLGIEKFIGDLGGDAKARGRISMLAMQKSVR